jgi:putative MATE family efflux protein
MFSDEYLRRLILPLVGESFLAVTIGMADTVMVSVNGEFAVSGISLVDAFSQLMIALFSAFATGGAVVSSQYLGNRDRASACEAGRQLYNLSLVVGLVLVVLLLPIRRPFLRWLFGHIEQGVMDNSVIYFFWIILSFPFLAVYNSSAALFRSMGNSKVSLQVSLLMNIINIGGNAILIYGMHMGVAGAGIATLASRFVSAVAMTILLRNDKNEIYLSDMFPFHWNRMIISKILQVGIPSGVENSVFQIGKLLVQNFIAGLGTASLAANAICNSVAGFANIPGNAMGLAAITVVGQCVGAGNTDEASYYAKKLLWKTYLYMGITSLAIYAFSPTIVSWFNLSQEAKDIAVSVLKQCMLFTALIWPTSFELPNNLRAAGDAKFTMIVSMCSMWGFRVVFAYFLSTTMGLGLNGIWMGMYIDWICRALCFIIRFKNGKWKEKRLI